MEVKEICHAHNGKKKVFQAEVTTNAKSVRQDHIW